MTISTTQLFSRGVQLMNKQQTDLASIQEKVATGKELVRPSDSPDLAVNIARIKSTIGQLDSYKDSLNSVNDRLRIEESYVEGAKDVLIKLKQLTIQGANAAMSGRDREVLAVEVDELVAEMRNLANGTDANGNFLFAGSRVSDPPYAEDDDGVIRYQGDNFRPSIDFTANRRAVLGRNGLDLFRPIVSSEFEPPTPGIYEISSSGTFESGDVYGLTINDRTFEHTIGPGESISDSLGALAQQINDAASLSAKHRDVVASVVDGKLVIESGGGVGLNITTYTGNTSDSVDDLTASLIENTGSEGYIASISGTMEPGDSFVLTVGSRSLTHVITDDDLALADDPEESVLQAIKASVNESGLFGESVFVDVNPATPGQITITPTREEIGAVSFVAVDRTAIDNQVLTIDKTQDPVPVIRKRVEFFESLQQVSVALRNGTQDELQLKLGDLDQMLDVVTLGLADIGSEMNSIDDEISVNESLKLQLQATLSREEDLDFTSAITELQAKLMALEAAQSSFAKISQLSLFDYIR